MNFAGNITVFYLKLLFLSTLYCEYTTTCQVGVVYIMHVILS